MNTEPTIINIQAIIAASPEKVWSCYTLPEHITKWNFASPDWHCPSASNELRPGGKYVARMEARDGSFGFDFEATYQEVSENERLVYRIADGRKVVCMLSEAGDLTVIAVSFEAENVHPADLQQAGWQSILDNFKRYVEGLG